VPIDSVVDADIKVAWARKPFKQTRNCRRTVEAASRVIQTDYRIPHQPDTSAYYTLMFRLAASLARSLVTAYTDCRPRWKRKAIMPHRPRANVTSRAEHLAYSRITKRRINANPQAIITAQIMQP